VNIILKRPSTEGQLIKDIGLYPKFVKFNSDSIFSLYDETQNINIENLPMYDKLTAKQGLKHKKNKEKLYQVCEKLNITPALIINVTDLKALIAADKDLSDLEMWQLITA